VSYLIFGIKNIGTVSKEEGHPNLDKILVVDDEKNICRMISNILKEEGYKVDKAYDGEQAVRKVKARGYNLVLLDYKLPGIDGINVLKEIQLIEPSLKVIMISAYGSPTIKSMAKKLGVYRFLDKPFDLNRLVRVVKDALAKEVRAKS
jgi:DNA-binding NtrC family response regulator